MITRKKAKFFVEIFSPEHKWHYMGKIIIVKGTKLFCTHFKKPDIHFYIKQQGYPINHELLKELDKIHIRHILIPEDGKTGFRCYHAKTRQYLQGTTIAEPNTEKQMVTPLKNLEVTDLVSKKDLEMMLK